MRTFLLLFDGLISWPRRVGVLALALLLTSAPGWAANGPVPQPGATAGLPLLADALNPDGSLRAGADGSFDATNFRLSTAPDGRPVFRPSHTTGAGDEKWQSGFTQDGPNDYVYAVVRMGADIYVGGNFTVVGTVGANHVAKWNGTTWSALGSGPTNGVNGSVRSMAVSGTTLYVAGGFTTAGSVAATRVARWDGSSWSALGSGVGSRANDFVAALAVTANGDLYAGGNFGIAGGVFASYVARWNGSAWSAVTASGNTNAVNDIVTSLTANGNDLYVGGNFIGAGGQIANGVARWNGTAWSSMGTGTAVGVDGSVMDMAVGPNGDLYVVGTFTHAGGVPALRVAHWNGTAWSAMGSTPASGFPGYVNAVKVAASGDVYVGGYFQTTGSVAANSIARWNGTAWNTLGTGLTNGVGNGINAMIMTPNGDLYVGGDMNRAGSTTATNMARWNGTAWSSLGLNNAPNRDVLAVLVAGSNVYIAGDFTQVGSVFANHIAKWNGLAWSTLGTGPTNGINGTVRSLALAPNNDLYAGGSFTQAGGVASPTVARWNGTAWSSVNAPLPNNSINQANALVVAPNGTLYVGGNFYPGSGAPTSCIISLTGTTWSPLGSGLSSTVKALALAPNGDLYAGGRFSSSANQPGNYVARWNGTAWSALGSNDISNDVTALALAPNGDLYACGDFAFAGGRAVNHVARWNGTTWSGLGTAASFPLTSLSALAVSGSGEVYVGGNFALVRASGADYIAKWNGTAWGPAGTGLNSYVYALAVGPGDKLYAGGSFSAVGDGSKATFHFGIYDPNAPAATTPAAAPDALQLFPNPTHGTAVLALPATGAGPSAQARPVRVLDALGREVRRTVLPARATQLTLDLRGLPTGAYVVRCGTLSQRLVVD